MILQNSIIVVREQCRTPWKFQNWENRKARNHALYRSIDWLIGEKVTNQYALDHGLYRLIDWLIGAKVK